MDAKKSSFVFSIRDGIRKRFAIINGLSGIPVEVNETEVELFSEHRFDKLNQVTFNTLHRYGMLVGKKVNALKELEKYQSYRIHTPAFNPSVWLMNKKSLILFMPPIGNRMMPKCHPERILKTRITSDFKIRLLKAAMEGQKLSELISICQKRSLPQIVRDIKFLTARGRQLIRFVPSQVSFADLNSPANALYENIEINPHYKLLTANKYYKSKVNSKNNFEYSETTINFSFRAESEALENFSYPVRLFKCLIDQRLIANASSHILEIGAGYGHFANSILNYDLTKKISSYTIIDVSPVLVKKQKSLLRSHGKKVKFLISNFLNYEICNRYDLIFCNEVISDLPFKVIFSQGEKKIRYDGVQRFLKNIKAALKDRQSRAVVIEYGTFDSPVEIPAHLNHAEVGIDFKLVSQMARELELDAEVIPLKELLHPNNSVPMLIAQQEKMDCLNAAFKFAKLSPLEFRSYCYNEFYFSCKELIKDKTIGGIQFSDFDHGRYFGPSMDNFFTLILRLK
jgi:SAM-dependent methyltransferase